MDYEKEYKEALQRARELQKTITGANYEYIFQELKESEDEKIRKNCIHFLNLQRVHHARTVEIDECIAWLKKQKQYCDNSPVEPWSDEQTRRNLKNFLDSLGATVLPKASWKRYVEWIEKQKVVPKFKVGDTIILKQDVPCLEENRNKQYKIIDITGDKYVTDEGDILLSAQNNFELIQNHVQWSKEDEEMLEACIAICAGNIRFAKFKDVEEYTENCKDWLESLKQRMI